MNPFNFSVSTTALSEMLAAFKGNPIPQSPPPAQAGAAPASHPWLCLEGDFQKILVKGWFALLLVHTLPCLQLLTASLSHGMGGVSPCSCNTDFHHHHLSLYLHKAEQQQLTS